MLIELIGVVAAWTADIAMSFGIESKRGQRIFWAIVAVAAVALVVILVRLL